MIDPITKTTYEPPLYHNVLCKHYEGLTYSTFETNKICPICNCQL